MDINGSHVAHLHTPDRAQAETAQHAVQAQGVGVITDPAERTAVRDYMRDRFAQYRLPVSPQATPAEADLARAQHEMLDSIADSRSERLLQEGENLAAIRSTMENAGRLDRYATHGTALVGGLPFTGVVAAQFAKPEIVSNVTKIVFGEIDNGLLKATAEGGVGGMEAHFPDEFFQRLFAEAKADAFFLKAPADKLHPDVARGLEAKQQGAIREALEDAKQIQTYLVGAVITGTVSASLRLSGRPEAADLFNKIAVPLRNYASGLATANLKHNAQTARQERGEALLFGLRDAGTSLDTTDQASVRRTLEGEQDWFSVYKAAKQGSVLSAIGHGGQRLGNMLLGVPANALDAAGKALISANSFGGGYFGLGATFAARAAAERVGTNAVSGPAAQTIVGTSINTLGTGVAFGIWAFVASMTSTLSDKGKAWLNDDNHAKPKEALRSAPRALGNAALTGAQFGYGVGRAGGHLGAQVARRGLETGTQVSRSVVETGQRALAATGRMTDELAASASTLTRRIRSHRPTDDLESQVSNADTQAETHEMQTPGNANRGGTGTA